GIRMGVGLAMFLARVGCSCRICRANDRWLLSLFDPHGARPLSCLCICALPLALWSRLGQGRATTVEVGKATSGHRHRWGAGGAITAQYSRLVGASKKPG